MAGRGRNNRPYGGGTNIYTAYNPMHGQQPFMRPPLPPNATPLLNFPQNLGNQQRNRPLIPAPPNAAFLQGGVPIQQQQPQQMTHSVAPPTIYPQMIPYSVPPTQSLPPTTTMYPPHQGSNRGSNLFHPPPQSMKTYSGPSQASAPQNKQRRAVRIVDPNTNEEVNISGSRSSNTSTPTPTASVSSLAPTEETLSSDQAKRDQFKQQIHETLTATQSKQPAPPNAIVSAPPTMGGAKTPVFVPSKPTTNGVPKLPNPQVPIPDSITTEGSNDPDSHTITPAPVPLFPCKTEGSTTISLESTESVKPLEPAHTPPAPEPDTGYKQDHDTDHQVSSGDQKVSSTDHSSNPSVSGDDLASAQGIEPPQPTPIDNSPNLKVSSGTSIGVETPQDLSTVTENVSSSQDTPSRLSPSLSDHSSNVQDLSEPSSLDSTRFSKPPLADQAPVEEQSLVADEPDTSTDTIESEIKTLAEKIPLEEVTLPPKSDDQSSLSKEPSPSTSPNIDYRRTSDADSKRGVSDSKRGVSGEGERKRSRDVGKKGMAMSVTVKEEGELSDDDIPLHVVNGGSPAPPEKYERDFLLKFKYLVTTPPVGLDKSIEVYTGEDSSHSYRKHKSGGPGNSKRIIEHRPKINEDVDLRKAENRWVRPKDRDNVEDGDPDVTELLRKFQGILNKLTPQKFKELAEKALALPINTEDRLIGCIDKIFQKALEEPNFSVAYANLCRVMSAIKVPTARAEEGKSRDTSFRRELLTKCQKEFEKDKKADQEIESLQALVNDAATEEEKKQRAIELEETQTKMRHRSLGNIRFIGELFKLEMLSEGIMHECIIRLLRSASDEESLECFCGLITTTGKLLDKSEAKQRLDQYFNRISDIIEKKKISARIRFKLQDVQDLRKNEWVPRRQDTLKTIDQIHAEAKMEEIKEQEMIRNMQPTGKGYPRGGDDGRRRGSKPATSASGSGSGSSNQDDWNSSRKGEKPRRDSTPDVSRIQGLKKKETSVQLGPTNFRPGGWGNKKAVGGADSKDKDKSSKSGAPSRSGSGPKRASGSGSSRSAAARRSSTQPDPEMERAEAIKLLKDMQSGSKSPTVVADRFDEAAIEKRSRTIVDEYCNNNDLKEAEECIRELQSPGLMHVFVREAINGTLESNSANRKSTGKLLNSLVEIELISEDQLHTGLSSCLEFANDLIIDIPKLYDFLVEQLGPVVMSRRLPLHSLVTMLDTGDVSHKERVFAKLLTYCVTISSIDDVTALWNDSKLNWTNLGLEKNEIEQFLHSEKLAFLSNSLSSSALPSFETLPYLNDLTVLFRDSSNTTDDIFEWIQKTVQDTSPKSPKFIRSLTRAAVSASITGEGMSARYNDDMFLKRLDILKRWVDMNEQLQMEVLNSVQVGLAFLKQPPGLIVKMFESLYNIEVVSESSFLKWRNRQTGGIEDLGRGVAVEKSKPFFKWLENADIESDDSH